MRATLTKAAVFSALIIIGTHNMYAEEEFGIAIGDDDAVNAHTIGRQISLIKKLVGEK